MATRHKYDDIKTTCIMAIEKDYVTWREEDFEDATIKFSYFRRYDESGLGIHGFIERRYHDQARERCARKCDLVVRMTDFVLNQQYLLGFPSISFYEPP